MSRYADAIHLTEPQWQKHQTEIENASPEQPAEKLTQLLNPRLSRKRCKEHLITLVREGKINLTSVDALYAWTYGAVIVQGHEKPEDIPGKSKPLVTMTEEQWTKIKPARIAALLQEHQTEKRAAQCMLACIRVGVYKPTAADVVSLTNERVTIEGVTAPERTRKGLNLSLLVAGIQ